VRCRKGDVIVARRQVEGMDVPLVPAGARGTVVTTTMSGRPKRVFFAVSDGWGLKALPRQRLSGRRRVANPRTLTSCGVPPHWLRGLSVSHFRIPALEIHRDGSWLGRRGPRENRVTPIPAPVHRILVRKHLRAPTPLLDYRPAELLDYWLRTGSIATSSVAITNSV
jgi:hypothetical protein